MDDMEARLNQKQQIMINQFVAMETFISQIQTQSQWLTQQINQLSSG
jgi:flagellar capping protein FliD